MKYIFYLLFFLLAVPASAQKKIPSPESQINTAILAAPEDKREGAKVYGYDQEGKMVVLREGSNNMICLADDPDKDGISVACYSNKLEPFMARGRELIAEGKSELEKREIRKKEVEAGKLKMPDTPSTLYIFSGDEEDYDPATGALKNGNFRYVIYMPYATVESTGLADKPDVPGMPWLMEPGTYRAHIMITPPKNE
ncbi:hypothetical protein C7S20_12405 [Christiangramia fulva]|uniref:Uncharacterized protein n=1 Tax=Christiangramia fulva TaxID=2126553 RepID=A0A2R3Z6T7_9FLAO|nr:hypothetical protein [Christiangramia fulva]AVR45990.1 hypothetical protein C7S20_12405 [Christiangramia fulva]